MYIIPAASGVSHSHSPRGRSLFWTFGVVGLLSSSRIYEKNHKYIENCSCLTEKWHLSPRSHYIGCFRAGAKTYPVWCEQIRPETIQNAYTGIVVVREYKVRSTNIDVQYSIIWQITTLCSINLFPKRFWTPYTLELERHKNLYPIQGLPLQVVLRHRVCSRASVMWTEGQSDIVFVPLQKLSDIVWTEPYSSKKSR